MMFSHKKNEVNILEEQKGMDKLMKLILAFNEISKQQQDEVVAYAQGHVAAHKLFNTNNQLSNN